MLLNSLLRLLIDSNFYPLLHEHSDRRFCLRQSGPRSPALAPLSTLLVSASPPFTILCPISTIRPSCSNRFIDWCETFSVAGYDDAPGLTLNTVAVNPLTVFYRGLVGLGRLKCDIKERGA